MPLTRDQAMCIRVWDWSETSQTISLFGRETGIVRCIAKGAKREGAKFSGGLELLTRGEMMLSLKGADALSLLTSWDLLETFPAARRTMPAFYAAMALLDIVQCCIRDADPHAALYDQLVESARTLEARQRWCVAWFLWAALSHTGHAPELTQDVKSGKPLADAPVYAFSPRLGGLLQDGTHDIGDEVWRIRAETVQFLRTAGLTGALPDNASDETADRAVRLLASYFRYVFECECPALGQFLDHFSSSR